MLPGSPLPNPGFRAPCARETRPPRRCLVFMENKTLAACLTRVTNRFELVTLGWKRAHQLIEGAPPFVARQGDKAEAHALREIAAGAFRTEEARAYKPVMDPIYEPVPPPVEEDLPRDEDQDDDFRD